MTLERNDASMVRQICNVTPDDRISAEELKTRQKDTRECLQDNRLRLFGHLERTELNVWSSKGRTFKIGISFSSHLPGSLILQLIFHFMNVIA